MFENLGARAAQIAARRAADRRQRLAARLKEFEPQDVQVTDAGEKILLAGRGLARRFALDPRLRWWVTEARDER